MEEIQFFNYILSIIAAVVAMFGFWTVWKIEDRVSQEIKDIREKLNTISNRVNESNKNARK